MGRGSGWPSSTPDWICSILILPDVPSPARVSADSLFRIFMVMALTVSGPPADLNARPAVLGVTGLPSEPRFSSERFSTTLYLNHKLRPAMWLMESNGPSAMDVRSSLYRLEYGLTRR